ncbi:MAG: DUF2065 domain-containing protein [Gammaproteobacteria bacterium]|nr:DUF2065 domain-containing protein [Gammaproteobacteria bacterium]
MDWTTLGSALALVFVIEGIFPFIGPRRFRQTLLHAVTLSDRTLRVLGLVSMVSGVFLLYLLR